MSGYTFHISCKIGGMYRMGKVAIYIEVALHTFLKLVSYNRAKAVAS